MKDIPIDQNLPQLVTIDRVAAQLNVRVTTFRSWLRRGFVPKHTYMKIGNTYRFDLDAVIAGVKNNIAEIDPVDDDGDPITDLDLDNLDEDGEYNEQ